MSSRKEKVKERFFKIAKNDTQYGITMIIKTYGSANIKLLSEILGKTESTIFHHISELVKEPKVIELDVVKTETQRGKYYKLTKELEEHYERDEQVHHTDIPEILDKLLSFTEEELYDYGIKMMKESPDLGKIALAAKRSLDYHYILDNIIIRNYEKTEQAILKGQEPLRKNIPFPGISNLDINIKIASPRHIILISKAVNELFIKLTELKKQFQLEMDKQKIKDEDRITSHIHLFGGELGEFPFQSKK